MHVVKRMFTPPRGVSRGHIGRGVAGIDRHNRQRRRIEMVSPVVKGNASKLRPSAAFIAASIVGAVG